MLRSMLNLTLAALLAAPMACAAAAGAPLPNANPSLQAPGLTPRPLKQVLPAEQAFPLSVLVELPDTLVVMWDIGEGYYLYRKSLRFTETGASEALGPAALPGGMDIHDEYFGDVEVYYDRLLARLPITDTGAREIELMVQYQGCAEAGYCYPMQQKRVSIEIPQ